MAQETVGVSPERYLQVVPEGGAGLILSYGVHPTPFGDCLLAASEGRICWLSFLGDGRVERALTELRRAWPQARLVEDQETTRGLAQRAFLPPSQGDAPPPLLVKGTAFQIEVWKALLSIPFGQVVSYGDVARMVGRPRAARAVGQAVGANPIAYLVPCHRVIRGSGDLGGYGGGVAKKRAMLAWERAQVLGDE